MTDLMAIASAALGLALSEPVPLAGSDRSSVLRCRTSANGTVVVKSYPASASGTEGFAAENAGLTFLAGIRGAAGRRRPAALAGAKDMAGTRCPGNNLITKTGVKFIDFESAEFHSVFLDAAYRYRGLLSGTFPWLAVDEIWHQEVRRAMAAWTLHAMTYLPDRSVAGDESMNRLATHAPTRRQLLRYRWQRLGEELDQAGDLPAISALMSSLLEATQSWQAPGLPRYPAFC